MLYFIKETTVNSHTVEMKLNQMPFEAARMQPCFLLHCIKCSEHNSRAPANYIKYRLSAAEYRFTPDELMHKVFI